VRRAVVLLAAAMIFAGLRPAPVAAQDRLEAVKRTASAAITRRALVLKELVAATRGTVRLKDGDRSALTTYLQNQIHGLSTLNAKIQSDTDEATVRADAAHIVDDYRVYVLSVPKARGVIVADLELAAADRLSQLADRLGSAVDRAAADGKDTTKAKADHDALRAKIQAARSGVEPLPAALLTLEPAGYPGNRPVLEQSRAALRAGRTALAEAARAARQVAADLRA